MTFVPDPSTLPKPADSERLQTGLAHWLELAAAAPDAGLGAFMKNLAEQAAGKALLGAIFGNSPWLTRCMLAEPAFFRVICETGVKPALAVAFATLDDLDAGEDIMRRLRVARRRAALVIAMADISGA